MLKANLLKAALMYADRGYKVFPCVPGGKEPLTKRGYKDASANPKVIAAWWNRTPQANIGLPMSPNGLVAIDPDLYKPDCGWTAFIADKVLPATWTQETASGGRHYIFTAPRGHPFAGAIARSTEIKWNGYIVAAPSIYNGKLYKMIGHQKPAPAPDWLLAARTAGGPPAPGGGARPEIGDRGYGLLNADDLAFFLAGLNPADYSGDEFWQLICACAFVTAGSGVEAFVTWAKGRREGYKQPRKMNEVRRRWRDASANPGRVALTTLRWHLRQAGRNDLADGLNQMDEDFEDELIESFMEFQTNEERLRQSDLVAKGVA